MIKNKTIKYQESIMSHENAQFCTKNVAKWQFFYKICQPKVLPCLPGHSHGIRSDIKVSIGKLLGNCHSRPECEETHLIYYVNCLKNSIYIYIFHPLKLLCQPKWLFCFFGFFFYWILSQLSVISFAPSGLKRLLCASIVIFFQRENTAHRS